MKRNLWLALMVLAGVLTRPAMAEQAADLDKAFRELKQYDSGKSPAVLEAIRIQIRKSNRDAALRADLEARMIAVLASTDATYDAKQFSCKQLGRIGTKASLPALAELLKDKTSASNAVLALQAMPGAEAGAVLRKAVDTSPARLDIIQALSARREAESIPVLARLAKDTNAELSTAAIAALGVFPEESAAEALNDALAAGRSTDQVNPALLRCAQALAKAGKTKAALKIYRQLHKPDASPPIGRASLLGIIQHGDKGGVDLFLSTLKGKDSVLRRTANGQGFRLLGERARGVLGNVMERLPDLSTEEQTMLVSAAIDLLGADMTPHLLKLKDSDSAELREAGLHGLARVGGASVVPALLEAAGEKETQKEALAALRKVQGKGVNQAIGDALEKAGSDCRAGLIDVLQDRNAACQVPRFLELMSQSDPKVAVAACKALGDLAGKEHLRTLLGNLIRMKHEEARGAAEQAIIRIARPTKEVAGLVLDVCAKLGEAGSDETRMSLLRLLGGLGGERSLAELKKAKTDSSEAVADVAVRELCTWPDASVLPVLIQIIDSSDKKVHRILALRGCARLLTTVKGRPVSKDAAKYVQPALQAAQRLLADNAIKREAALAIVSMAPAAARSNRDAARAALLEAASRNKDDKNIGATVGKCLRSLKLDGKPGLKKK